MMRALALALIIAAACPAPASAVAGLDVTFGDGGISRTQLDEGGFGGAYDVVVQSDGKIVAAGWGVSGAVIRYMEDGTLDQGFGVDGVVRLDHTTRSMENIWAVSLDPAGRLLIAGLSDGKLAVVRLLGDGRIDDSYGTGGVATASFAVGATAQDIEVLPDGRLLVGATASRWYDDAQTQGQAEYALVRFTSDGALDPTFGVGGIVEGPRWEVPPSGSDGRARELEVAPDGRVYLGGIGIDRGERVIGVARYLPDGAPDPSWGTGGVRYGPETCCGDWGDFGMVLQPDGRLVAVNAAIYHNAAGEYWPAQQVVRYMSDGRLDLSFGLSGYVLTPIGHDSAQANGVVLDAWGRILVAGHAALPLWRRSLTLSRYLPNGRLDPDFGDGGVIVVPPPADDDDHMLHALTLDQKGRVVAVGRALRAYVAARFSNPPPAQATVQRAAAAGVAGEPRPRRPEVASVPAIELHTPLRTERRQATTRGVRVRVSLSGGGTVRVRLLQRRRVLVSRILELSGQRSRVVRLRVRAARLRRGRLVEIRADAVRDAVARPARAVVRLLP